MEDQPTTYPLWTEGNRYGTYISQWHPAMYGVFVEIAPNSNIWAAKATHGSSYQYDREVPILFYGEGIENGVATELAFTRDVAPTLASLINIPIQSQVDGKVLELR